MFYYWSVGSVVVVHRDSEAAAAAAAAAAWLGTLPRSIERGNWFGKPRYRQGGTDAPREE